MAVAAQQPQIVMLSATDFLHMTKAKRAFVQNNGAAYRDGAQQVFQLPQAGFAETLWISVQGTIVVGGTISSGTFNSYGQGTPAPWSIFRRIQLASNNGLTLRDIDGWSWYKWIRYRYGFDPMKTVAVNYSTNTLASLGINQGSGAIVAGANVTATTYTFNTNLPMPMAYNQAAEAGLISLQNNNTIYQLTITWGQVTGNIGSTGGSNDLFNALVGTSVTVTATINTYVELEFWEVPNLPSNLSLGVLMSQFVSVTSSSITGLVTGNNQIKPPTNDLYTLILTEWFNNGATIAPANLQNPLFTHSNNQYDQVDVNYPYMARDLYMHQGLPGMDGVIAWDMGLRRGSLVRRDTIDAFNDRQITNMTLQVTIPSTLSITGANGIYIVYEVLNNFGT